MPMARRAYLRWPRHDAAYAHDRQYLLGSQLLVAPVGTPGDPAEKEVWFPPGEWIDVFTGERHLGPGTETLAVPLDRMPVFARAGAIVPKQGYRRDGSTDPPGRLIVDVYPGSRGRFELYEDEGDGLAHERGRFSLTRISQRTRGGAVEVSIGPAKGDYPGRPRRRSYRVRVHDGGAEPEVARTGRVRTDRRTRLVIDLRR
jgi:alpha-glucosidase (family GH31 glycosyl hydrolase)